MIKFVYFDVGGVLLKDFGTSDEWSVMKKLMGVKPDFDKEFEELYDKYEDEVLCTTLPVDDLMPIFEKKFGMQFPKGFSMHKYFIEHFEPNVDLVPVISKIKETKPVGLLTNQYVGMFEDTQKHGLLPDFDWDVVVDSSIIKLRKPDKEIFAYAEAQTGVGANEILFIDNSAKNINAANALGWQTFLFDQNDMKGSSFNLLEYYLKTDL